MKIDATDIHVPCELEPAWRLRAPRRQGYLCEGCDTAIDEGFDAERRHTVLDCLRELKHQISLLKSEIEDLKRAASDAM